MKPHLVRERVNAVTRERTSTERAAGVQLELKPENIAVVKNAMVGVNLEGTSAASFRNTSYTSAGKTGTAQVVQIKQNEKYNASRVDELHRDHALFIAFAPAESPRIALAMVVENVGFGAQFAAPIARRVFDYVLQGLYPSEDDIEAVQKGQAPTPIGKPRLASELDWPPKP
jgi:penicillin-binding protein 2